MPARIDVLTDEQRARMPEWAAKWIAVGLSTEPADFERFERAARACYRYSKFDEPKVIVRVPSPLVLALAAPIAGWLLDNRTDARKRRGIAATRVEDAVRGAVGGAVRGAVGGAVEGAVEGAVGGAGADRYRVLRQYISARWAWLIGGQFSVGWWWYWGPSSWSFFRDVCGLELKGDLWQRAQAYEETTRSAGWWWPHREFVMVCDRPRVLNRDERGRLHCEDGPSITWEGFSLWTWHGVQVPADVIMAPDRLTAKRITDETNAEVRRVMVERFGADRYIRESGAQQVAKDDWGTLWRARMPGDEDLVMVEVLNSTAEPDGTFKTYFLRVPPQMRTPREAIAWTFNEAEDFATGDDYAPMVQT